MHLRTLRFFPAVLLAAAGASLTACGAAGSVPASTASAISVAAQETPAVKAFDWLQPGIDATHLADNKSEKKLKAGNVATLKLGWTFAAYGSVAPILTDGSLAIVNTSNYVYGVSIKTGAQKWSFETYASQNDGFTYAAIANGLVFVGCNVGGYSDQEGLCAVNARSGKLAWSWYDNCKCAPSAFDLVGPVISGSTVVFGYGTGGAYSKDILIALDASTGAVLWSATAGSGTNSLSVAIPAIDGGNVFAGTDYGLCSYQLSSGTLNWCSGPSDYGTAPAVSNGVVYVTTTSHGFYAYDESTGTQIWQYAPSTGSAGYYDPPAIAGNDVYFSMSQGGPVYALSASSGSLAFTAGGGSRYVEAIASPSVANGVLYVPCYGGLCAFNASTGASLATIGPEAAAGAAATVANARVYLSCGNRTSGFTPCMYRL